MSHYDGGYFDIVFADDTTYFSIENITIKSTSPPMSNDGCIMLTLDLDIIKGFSNSGIIYINGASGLNSSTNKIHLIIESKTRLNIYSNSFKDCVNLKSLDLKDCINLEYIEDSAFLGCSSLGSVVFPKTASFTIK